MREDKSLNKYWGIIGVFFITAAMIIGEVYNTLLPRALIVFGLYLFYAWIRVTRWWNIVFDLLMIIFALISTVFLDKIPNDKKIYALIAYMVIGCAYFITIVITDKLGYPIIKEKYKTQR